MCLESLWFMAAFNFIPMHDPDQQLHYGLDWTVLYTVYLIWRPYVNVNKRARAEAWGWIPIFATTWHG